MTQYQELKELGLRLGEALGKLFMFSLLTFPGAAIFATGFLGLFNYSSYWPDPSIWATGFFPYWVIATASVFLSGRKWFLVSCGFFIVGTLFMVVAVQYQWSNLIPRGIKENALFGPAPVVLAYLFAFISVPIATALWVYANHKMRKSELPSENVTQ